MRPKDCAYIVEHLSVRFMAMVADHSRQLAEHRASFGARTEADRLIIEGLRVDLDKVRAIVKEQSDHAKDAGTLLGWAPNESAFQAAQRVVKERDGLLAQVQDQRAEIERLRNDERKAYQDGEALRAEVADLRGIVDMVHASLGIKRGDHIGKAIEALKSQSTPTTKQHPVNGGEWVRKTTDGLMYKIGDTFRLESYEIKDGQIWCNLDNGASWLMSVCEPCDPPEASHDTPAGKEAAEAASKVPQ